MCQEKEFLMALEMMPNDKLFLQLLHKYKVKIINDIAQRCIQAGYIKNCISIELDQNNTHMTIGGYTFYESRLTKLEKEIINIK